MKICWSAENQSHREKRDQTLCCLGLNRGTVGWTSVSWAGRVNTAPLPGLSSLGCGGGRGAGRRDWWLRRALRASHQGKRKLEGEGGWGAHSEGQPPWGKSPATSSPLLLWRPLLPRRYLRIRLPCQEALLRVAETSLDFISLKSAFLTHCLSHTDWSKGMLAPHPTSVMSWLWGKMVAL